jgi:hypothetical protein
MYKPALSDFLIWSSCALVGEQTTTASTLQQARDAHYFAMQYFAAAVAKTSDPLFKPLSPRAPQNLANNDNRLAENFRKWMQKMLLRTLTVSE